jgi:TRAP-type mannitol/chloroaromatic compound transport system permease small subunit
MIAEMEPQSAPLRPLGPIDVVLTKVENLLVNLAALFIFGLMIIGVVQIVVRLIWNLPIPGYIDYVEQSMAIIAFVAIGYAERLGAHIRMDYLMQSLAGRAQLVAEFIATLIAWITISFLTYATWFSFLRAWQLGDSTMDIQLPVWPAKLAVVGALALLWLRLLLSLYAYARAVLKPVQS